MVMETHFSIADDSSTTGPVQIMSISMRSPLTVTIHLACVSPALLWGLTRLARAACNLPPEIKADRAEAMLRAERARADAMQARVEAETYERELVQGRQQQEGRVGAFAEQLHRGSFHRPMMMRFFDEGDDPEAPDTVPVPDVPPPPA
jgi:hypothetical protein